MSFRTEVICGAAAILALLFFRAAVIWWISFVMMIGLLLSAELFNTALEKLMDWLQPHTDKNVALVKDAAAGAVLELCLTSLIVFLIFLINQ